MVVRFQQRPERRLPRRPTDDLLSAHPSGTLAANE
jgi:hypothetical protein